MFGKCEKCVAMESEIAFLRTQTKELMDRLLAMASPQAYQAVHFSPPSLDDTYGGEYDEMVEYAADGHKILVTKKRPNANPSI